MPARIISILIGQIRSFLTFRELYTHGIWLLFHLPPSEIWIDFELFVFERDILKQRYGC